MTKPEMTYYPNGKIYTITYRNSDGKYHNDDGPACIRYYDNGQKEYVSYWIDGRWHNLKGPAIIWYYDNGQKEYEAYYVDGKWHNVSGPAHIEYYDNGQIKYETYWVEDKWIDGHKLIQELGINSDYTLWTDDEKDMFAFHILLEV